MLGANRMSVGDRKEYLLGELRCASLRARLAHADIDAVGLALRGGLISCEEAIELLADCEALGFIEPRRPTERSAA
jgi:hypothetical protein